MPQPLQNLKRLKTILYLPECWNSNRIFLSLKVLCDNCSRFHRQLFQDIYDWAGQIRTVDIVKGSSQVFQPLAFFDVGVQYAEQILDRDIKTARTQEAQNQTATVMNAMPLSGSLGAIRSALAGDPRFADPCGEALYGSKACADFVNEAKNIHARQIAEQFASEQGVRIAEMRRDPA